MTIRAISFDLWDTLVIDDSDEPKRAAAGLPPKSEARTQLFVDLVRQIAPDRGEAAARAAWDRSRADFRHAWKVEHHTPSVAWRIDRGLDALGLRCDPATAAATIAALGAMEVDLPPEPLPGAADTLRALSARFPLVIVSDAILTPGSRLRDLLEVHGLRRYFSAFVFSDEAGASKPDPRVFHQAAAAVGVEAHEILHVGDREETDVKGIHAVGGLAVFFTGAVDRGSPTSRADFIVPALSELVGIADRCASPGWTPAQR